MGSLLIRDTLTREYKYLIQPLHYMFELIIIITLFQSNQQGNVYMKVCKVLDFCGYFLFFSVAALNNFQHCQIRLRQTTWETCLTFKVWHGTESRVGTTRDLSIQLSNMENAILLQNIVCVCLHRGNRQVFVQHILPKAQTCHPQHRGAIRWFFSYLLHLVLRLGSCQWNWVVADATAGFKWSLTEPVGPPPT